MTQVARWRGGLIGFAFRLPPAMAALPNATASLLRALTLRYGWRIPDWPVGKVK